ncbi:hypothetical protein GOBAR_DD00542 [Gossypium barbadense]|nr:hypothetical protein GOBAR_DD00542 [Gossypium barbadense]
MEEGMQNLSIKEREGLELVFEFDIIVSDGIDYDLYLLGKFKGKRVINFLAMEYFWVQVHDFPLGFASESQDTSKVDDLENRCIDMEVVKKRLREVLTNVLVPCPGPVGEQ